MPEVVERPQVWLDPALIRVKPSPPATGRGLVRGPPIVPSPSWPWPPLPQQYATFAVVTPHVWSMPALICWNVSPPDTATGEVTAPAEYVPLPPSPQSLSPQQ